MIDTLEVASELESVVRQRLNGHGRLLAVRPLQSRRRAFSNVLRFSLSFEERDLDVCLKIHRRTNAGFQEECVDWAKEEFTLLEVLYSASPEGSPLSVVRPLLFLPRLPGILLETHPGQVLNAAMKTRWLGLRSPREPIERLAHYCFLAGKGLREMHRLTTEDERTLRTLSALSPIVIDAAGVLQAADDLFSRAFSLCRRGVRQAAEPIFQSSRAAFVAATAGRYPLVGAHGDCTPLNVFIDGSRVTFFDLVNYHRGHAFEDVSRFISYTYFLQKNPLAFRRHEVSGLIRAFLEGYGLASWRTDPVLRFFFEKSMFRTLGGGFDLRSGRRPLKSLYRRAMLRVFQRWVTQGMPVP